jgi:hypothetical protein
LRARPTETSRARGGAGASAGMALAPRDGMRIPSPARFSTIYLVALACLLVAACAAGSQRFVPDHPAGFWFGLWHGVIAPISFVVSLFDGSVQIYERTNTGAWYDLGFLLGILTMSGCGHHSQRRLRVPKGKDGFPKGRGKAHVKIDVAWNGEDDGAPPPPP